MSIVLDTLGDLWQGRRSPLAADLDLAELALASKEPIDRIAGSAIILISQSGRVPLERICGGLSELCLLASETPAKFHFLLTSTIVMIPDEMVLRDRILKRFIYRAIFSESTSSRCNAILLLDRLAKKGDQTSMELLHIARKDEDSDVSTNATTSLRELDNLVS